MYGYDDLFWKETVEGYSHKQFPKNYFHKSIAKARGKTLLKHICNLDGRLVEEIFLDLNDEWIEQYRLDKFEKYLPLRGTTRFDRIVDLFRFTFPTLPEFDLNKQIVRWHTEIIEGRRKGYPYRCFEGKVGTTRALLLLKHVKNKYKLKPEEITTEALQTYRLPLIRVLASTITELQGVYEHLAI